MPVCAQESGQTSDDNAPAPKPYPQGITCIWLPNLDSQYYTVIDDQHLVIDAVRRTFYLLTLSRRCFDLDTTLDIGLSHRGEQLCTGDAIIIDRDRCPIQYIEQVGSEAEAKKIVDGREAAEKAQRKGGSN